MKVTQTKIIHAPQKKLFSVVTDYAKYTDFLSDITKARVVKKTKSSKTVDFEATIIKAVAYTLKLTEKPYSDVSWTLVNSNLMKVNNGSWELIKMGENKTKAIYSLEIEFAIFIPSSIVEMLVSINMPKTLLAFKKRAESMTK